MSPENKDQELSFEQGSRNRLPVLVAYAVMIVATTGYFIGVTAPMTSSEPVETATQNSVHSQAKDASPDDAIVLPATTYRGMTTARKSPNHDWTTSLASLKQTPYDPFANIVLNQNDKIASLSRREQRRAFNGAPPTVPHPIDQYTSRGCMACHGEGLRSESIRASKMPHPFYVSCTQCHVEQKAKFSTATLVVENSFDGLPAPTAGTRAFATAPPVVPHSTSMREDCLSCHGRTAEPGMESTHPWRTNCQQCHAPKAKLNHVPFAATSKFLSGPVIGESDE